MLYKTFIWLFYLTTKAYFRSIYVKGKEYIPQKSKPVIFVANHPSSFMDPILLAVLLNRSMYFLTRGDVFKKKYIGSFFNKLHMIPVYKPDLSPDQVYKNEMIFEKCYEHLTQNKTLIIFPEGLSKTERKLRHIKTGTARIALGAEEINNFNLELSIVPIGLNYSNPHYFKSDVFINIGYPINVKDYKEIFQKNKKEGVLQLTQRIKEELEKRIVIIDDEKHEKIIQQIEILYHSKLKNESKLGEKITQDFYLSQHIVKAVEYYSKNKPEVLEDFKQKILHYLKHLKRLRIRDTQIKSSSITLNYIWFFLLFTVGFPFFLCGLITNIIPFKLAQYFSSKIIIRDDFIGSIKTAVGMFAFLIMYFIEAIVFGIYTNFICGLLFLFSLYPLGLFTMSYIKNYYKARGTIKYILLFIRKSDIIANLKKTRKDLVNELEERKKEYLENI